MARAVPAAGRHRTAAAPPALTCSKDELLRRYTALVRYVVERISAGLPRNVDHEDLHSAGVLGLLDAYQKFDARKGVKFETYAVWRIRGAVLDQLRSLDWASRSMRRRARELESTCQRMDQKLGRAASDHEVARAMRLNPEDYYRLIDQVRGATLLSLDEVRVSDDQESSTLGDHLPDPHGVDLEACLEEEESKAVLLQTLDRLPEQERLVVALYYYEQMTLKEIGRTLGISESRVSQVHTRAMARLRTRVARAFREAA
jgi:RNA polymerase sigma factor for flagellar operon FliA